MTRESSPVRMAHVALTVTYEGFDELSHFYRHIFGWRTQREIDGAYGRHEFLTDDHGSCIELLARDEVVRPERPKEPAGHVCFAVPDDEIDALLERARALGADVEEPQLSTPEGRNEPTAHGDDRPGGGVTRYAFLYDPSGNCLEISSGAYRALVSNETR